MKTSEYEITVKVTVNNVGDVQPNPTMLCCSVITALESVGASPEKIVTVDDIQIVQTKFPTTIKKEKKTKRTQPQGTGSTKTWPKKL